MRGKKHVIVHVDDSLTARVMVRAALEEAGFEVHSAMDAQDLEQRLMSDGALRAMVDMFVLDMEMPDLMGAQVGAVVTDVYPEVERVPFVIYSGKSREWVENMSEEVARVSDGFKRNYKGYIGKEEGAEAELVAKIKSILGA